MPRRLHRAREWLAARLTHPWLPLHLALLAVALCLPALGAGFQLDDYFQRMIMLDRAAHDVEAMEAFSLMRGEFNYLDVYVDWGAFPWWSAEDLRLSFFRYLTVATVWLDYRLWPHSAPLMHLHSLLWLGALVAAVAVLYRRILGPTVVAGLAGLLYAVDEAHAGAASWLANRNALTATLFGVLCLLAHDRWRASGRRRGAWAGPVLLALGLASGEMALGALGYLLAYALFLDRSGRLRGTLALAGHAAVVLAWAVVYRLGGYGTRGSGLYLDPLGDAGAYLAALPGRLSFLLLGQWTAVPADVGWLLPADAARAMERLGWVVVAILAAALLPLLRRDRAARFWGLGMVLSLLPVAATFPSNRLLFFVGVGAMGLAAQLLGLAFGRERPLGRPGRIAIQAFAVLLTAQHLLVAPPLNPVNAAMIATMGDPSKQATASLPADPSIAGRDLVIVNAPDYLNFVTLIAVIRAVDEVPRPRRIRALSAGPAAITLTRLDPKTVRVAIPAGLYTGPLGELYRSRHDPLPAGSVVELTGVTVTVADDDGGVPVAVDYRFDVELEDPSLLWVRWEGSVYVPMASPAPGESLELAPPLGPYEEFAKPPS